LAPLLEWLFDPAAEIVAEFEKSSDHAGMVSQYLSIAPHDIRLGSYQHMRAGRMS
jgi:hypothetical protein